MQPSIELWLFIICVPHLVTILSIQPCIFFYLPLLTYSSPIYSSILSVTVTTLDNALWKKLSMKINDLDIAI